jgi:hypothetical protein
MTQGRRRVNTAAQSHNRASRTPLTAARSAAASPDAPGNAGSRRRTKGPARPIMSPRRDRGTVRVAWSKRPSRRRRRSSPGSRLRQRALEFAALIERVDLACASPSARGGGGSVALARRTRAIGPAPAWRLHRYGAGLCLADIALHHRLGRRGSTRMPGAFAPKRPRRRGELWRLIKSLSRPVSRSRTDDCGHGRSGAAADP